MTSNNKTELTNTTPTSTHIHPPWASLSSINGIWPCATHTTPITSVRRNTLDPTVLATKTPAWALRPDLNATSFSGRVVAIERIVRPAVDWVICSRSAREDVVEDSRTPERAKKAAERLSLTTC